MSEWIIKTQAYNLEILTEKNKNPKFSIVIAYLSKSKSISKCKEMLYKNTTNNFELIEIVDSTDVYDAFNQGVRKSSCEFVICLNDDMFVSRGWDDLYLKYADTNSKTILTGYVVEPGVVRVDLRNIRYNCGMHVEDFDYEKFQNFVDGHKCDEIIRNCGPFEHGWYMPILFYKSLYIDYPNEPKFPYPNDVVLIEEILPANGFNIAKIKSFVYHLQNYSTRT